VGIHHGDRRATQGGAGGRPGSRVRHQRPLRAQYGGVAVPSFVAIPWLPCAHSPSQVLTFVEEPKPLEEFESTYHSISSRGLPYIAAASAESPAEVLGYAYAQGFRDGKGAYRHTVEVTLFCHPDHRGKGIGSMLLTELLSALRAPEEHSRYRSGGADVAPRSVRQVLAVMAVDDEGPRNGLALKEFYEGFGFKLVDTLSSHGCPDACLRLGARTAISKVWVTSSGDGKACFHTTVPAASPLLKATRPGSTPCTCS